ncbi:hypothetical protein LSTR_LSTR017090 [Laodelphax striatellus]|uniref:Uncharacterized protein n=1 Tax=Laodelphax striatellus TaxID=195883 RepID=A0A482XAE1_LAOST|nr:hypothetical protein LSTR_LSTR017090 [Laodelphax striatellus]
MSGQTSTRSGANLAGCGTNFPARYEAEVSLDVYFCFERDNFTASTPSSSSNTIFGRQMASPIKKHALSNFD